MVLRRFGPFTPPLLPHVVRPHENAMLHASTAHINPLSSTFPRTMEAGAMPRGGPDQLLAFPMSPVTNHNAEPFSPHLPRPQTTGAVPRDRLYECSPLYQSRDSRARNTSLPPFDGRGGQWFRFYAAYRQSTAQCGYSPSENMERLEKILTGAARQTVCHLFQFPHLADQAVERPYLRQLP